MIHKFFTSRLFIFLGSSLLLVLVLFFFARSRQQMPTQKELSARPSPVALQAAMADLVIPQKILVYRHPKGWFSFSYPVDFSVGRFGEDADGETILVQETRSNLGVQIYSTVFDESGPVTKARILKDLPDLKIENDKQITIAGVSALEFTSIGDDGGRSKEVWFINGGRLYQISGFIEVGGLIEKILSTWQFK